MDKINCWSETMGTLLFEIWRHYVLSEGFALYFDQFENIFNQCGRNITLWILCDTCETCVVLLSLTNRELLQHVNFCRRRNKHLQQTVIKTEVQNNHSYDEGHNYGDHERFYWNEGARSRLKLLFIMYTKRSKKYFYAADRRIWEQIYRWNRASLQPMGK